MAEVGADLETMRNLHKGLDEHAQKAIDMKTGLDGHFSNTVWKGTNADKMRQAWEEFKPHLDKLHQSLSEAKDDVRTQHNNIAAATGESVSI
ncbi:MAG: WXG100 family type VII secretion target [Nocardioides sp.]|uniref:WXG100 family type VII secretion target n=1 Tax=Nocardioides sp. TaxID=35761 RepID=UPI0039E61F05